MSSYDPRLGNLLRGDVPADALVSYGRLWQLERWLRLLVIINYKAMYGSAWRPAIIAKAQAYQRNEDLIQLLSIDHANEMAFLDFPHIVGLIEAEWQYFESFLINKTTWLGDIEELKQIRRRIGHVRTPASGDLNRLETMLLAISAGVSSMTSALHSRVNISRVSGWSEADYGVDQTRQGFHSSQTVTSLGYKSYEVELELHILPWTQLPPTSSDITTSPGMLWGLEVSHTDRYVNPGKFMRSLSERTKETAVIFFMHSPGGIQCFLPTVNDAVETIAAIEDILQSFADPRISAQGGRPENWVKQSINKHHQLLVSTQIMVDYDDALDEGSVFLI